MDIDIDELFAEHERLKEYVTPKAEEDEISLNSKEKNGDCIAESCPMRPHAEQDKRDDSWHSDTEENGCDDSWSQLVRRLNARKQTTEATTTAAETSVSSNAESCNWNATYQHLNDLVCKTPHTKLQRAKKLRELMNAFKKRAAREVRDFVQYCEASSSIDADPAARIRICDGIALQRLDGAEATLIANQELRVFAALNELELNAVHTPLAAVMEYAGVSVYARAVIPAPPAYADLLYASSHSTGSSRQQQQQQQQQRQRPQPMSNDESVQKLLRSIRQHFNVRFIEQEEMKQIVDGQCRASAHTGKVESDDDGYEEDSDFEDEPTDGEMRRAAQQKQKDSRMRFGSIEVYESDVDGRLYLTDMSRFLPRFSSTATMTGRFSIRNLPGPTGYFFRPEFFVGHCCKMPFGGDNASNEAMAASFMNLCTQIDTLAKELDAELGSKVSFSADAGRVSKPVDDVNMADRFHSKGVNLRYLGATRRRCHSSRVRVVLLREMFVRSMKALSRDRIPNHFDSFTEEEVQALHGSGLRDCTVRLLHAALRADEHDKLWQEDMPYAMQKKFGIVLQPNDTEALRKVMQSNTHQALQLKRRLLTELGLEPVLDITIAMNLIASLDIGSSNDASNRPLSKDASRLAQQSLVGVVRLKLVGNARSNASFELSQEREYLWLTRRRDALGPEHASLAPILRRLVDLYCCWKDVHPAAAIVGLNRASSALLKLKRTHEKKSDDMLAVAIAYREIGHLQDAFNMLGFALGKHHDDNEAERPHVMRCVASLYRFKGELKRCTEILAMALASTERLVCEYSSGASIQPTAEELSRCERERLIIRLDYVDALLELGVPDEALKQLNLLLSRSRSMLMESSVAFAHVGLQRALVHESMSRWESAEQCVSMTLGVASSTMPEGSSERRWISDLLVLKGELMRRLAQPLEAVRSFQEALHQLDLVDGKRHRLLEKAKVMLALARAQGDAFLVRKKQQTLRDALQHCRQSLTPPTLPSTSSGSGALLLPSGGPVPDRVGVLLCMASLYDELGASKRRLQVLERTHIVLRSSANVQQQQQQQYGKMVLLDTLCGLGSAYASAHEHTKRCSVLQHAANLANEMFGPAHHRTCHILLQLALSYVSVGEHRRSLQVLRVAESGIKDSEHLLLDTMGFRVQIHIAEALESLRRFEAMRKVLENVLLRLETDPACDFKDALPVLSHLLVALARANHRCADFDKQPRLLERAIRLEKRWYGDSHPSMAETLRALGCSFGRLGLSELASNVLHMGWKMLQPFISDMDDVGVNRNEDAVESDTTAQDTSKEATQTRHDRILIQFVTISCDLSQALGRLNKQRSAIRLLEDVKFLLQDAIEAKDAAASTEATVTDISAVHTWAFNEQVARVCVALARQFALIGEHDEERLQLEKAAKLEKLLYGEKQPRRSVTLLRLAGCYGHLDLLARRLQCLREAALLISMYLPHRNELLAFVNKSIAGRVPFGKMHRKSAFDNCYEALDSVSLELDGVDNGFASKTDVALSYEEVINIAAYSSGDDDSANEQEESGQVSERVRTNWRRGRSARIRPTPEQRRQQMLEDKLKKYTEKYGVEHEFAALTLLELAESCQLNGDAHGHEQHLRRAITLARRHHYNLPLPVRLATDDSADAAAAAAAVRTPVVIAGSASQHVLLSSPNIGGLPRRRVVRWKTTKSTRPASAKKKTTSKHSPVRRGDRLTPPLRGTYKAARRPQSAPTSSALSSLPLASQRKTTTDMAMNEVVTRAHRERLRNHLLEYAYR